LRQLCLDCGADDVGFVGIDRPEIASQKAEIKTAFPATQALISIACRMNREPIRSPMRSITNNEFHETYETINAVARKITRELETRGVRALNLVSAFPMEVDRPAKAWVVGHKPVAEAAGLGKHGIHRSVIHPKFGSFIVLDTILVGLPITEEGVPLDFAPCLECKLCVAACPVDALGQDGSFNFSACYTHNYREYLGNFSDWTGHLADAKDRKDFRARVSNGENLSMWQSLSFKPGYKAAYCISVCPAGEDVIGPFKEDRIGFTNEFLKPLQALSETIYVLPRSDAEVVVPKRYPHKKMKVVPLGMGEARDPFSFFFLLSLTFQRRRSKGLNATFAIHLTGDAPLKVIVKIEKQILSVEYGKATNPDVTLTMQPNTLLHMLDIDFDLAGALAKGDIVCDGPSELLEKLIDSFPQRGDLQPA
jgi:NAD-dependent dihydropyrimidine dehydrogenase PreA subunit/putative sterol carrier protein